MKEQACILSIAVILCLTVSASAADPRVAFGNMHAVVMRNNGEVLTWGDSRGCELGRDPRQVGGATPVVVMRHAKDIAVASDHSLVLTMDGKVYGWGINAEGQLGTGRPFDECEGPVEIESLTQNRSA